MTRGMVLSAVALLLACSDGGDADHSGAGGANSGGASGDAGGSSGAGNGGAGDGGASGGMSGGASGASGNSGGEGGATPDAGGTGGSGGDSGTDDAGPDSGAMCRMPAEAKPFDLVIALRSTTWRANTADAIASAIDALVTPLITLDPELRVVALGREDPGAASTALDATNYSYVAIEDALDPLVMLVDELDGYASALRADAALAVLIVDDEDSAYEGGVDADERARFFLNDLTLALLAARGASDAPPIWVHAITSPGDEGDEACVTVDECCDEPMDETDPLCMGAAASTVPCDLSPDCVGAACAVHSGMLAAGAAAPGTTYTALARDTGGFVLSICTDLAAELPQLALELRMSASCEP